MAPPPFSNNDITRLFNAMVAANHLADGLWPAAIQPLMPLYRHSLPAANNPGGLFQALFFLNQSGRLTDGSIPFEVVLSGIRILSADGAVSKIAAQMLAALQGAETKIEYKAPQEEAYTGTTDDTLPFDFLEQGMTAGRSVVKLMVPRFEGGGPAMGSNGKQRMFRGTGWLVAPDLLMTNLHVVSARETDEPTPGDADLALQIKGTEVQLDYDRDGADGPKTTVVEGVAWGKRGGEHDYAILRVAKLAKWPAPLRLRQQPPSIPKAGYAVNVIQHPAGLPKRVAARSNLLRPITVATQLEYFSDTLGGSSGSPLCNDAWEVIGLHRASGPASNVVVNGKEASTYNIGIPIAEILKHLQTEKPEIFKEVQPQILP